MTGIRGERGAATLEMALLIPALLVLVAVTLGAGRVWGARSAVLAVAREAARAGVEEPEPAAAAAAAMAAAGERAEGYRLDPSRLVVEPEEALERGGRFAVRVVYHVALADLPGLGLLPASVRIEARHAEPVDPFAGR